MRAARLKDQLLCLVTPIAHGRTPLEVANEVRASAARLDALFRAHGGIHFATFTVLPPSPQGTPNPAGASLALTLAVDAGARPEQTLAQLAALAPQTLQAIYGVAAPEELRSVLLNPGNLERLTGGFIGTRDRSVAQILAEGDLARHLRRSAAAKPASTRADARRLATELSVETLADPGFAWARQPAPRGNWRAGVTPRWLRLGATAGWLVALGWCVLIVSALSLIGFASKLAVAALNEGWIHIADRGNLLTLRAVYTEGAPLGIWLRGLAFVVLLVNAVVIILVRDRRLPLVALEFALVISALAALFVAPGLAWLALSDLGAPVPAELSVAKAPLIYGIWVVMGLVALVAMVVACALFAWAVVPPYLPGWWLGITGAIAFAAALFALHFVLAALVLFAHRFQLLGTRWYQEDNHWGWQPVDRIALVVFCVAVVAYLAYRVLRRLVRWAGDELEQLNYPLPDRGEGLNRRLHQTAPSISACEAAWVGRPAVMISLTEVRCPYFFYGRLANFVLWMIGSLGWHFYSEGKLGGVGSIHYAHWHLVDRGRRLLFCSNFDGDFGGYLDEFILGPGPLLNAIWRWTCLGQRQGLDLGGRHFDAEPTRASPYPKTRLLLFSGCRREQQFKAYARESMLPFQYHFAAYDYPLGDILRSTLLRDALTAQRTPAGDAMVMRTLEA